MSNRSSRAYGRQRQHCLTSGQIPKDYQSCHILDYYRPPNSSLSYSLRSAFEWHNETINFWTHFLPLAVVAAFWFNSPFRLWPLTSVRAKYYPLLSYTANLFGMFFFSSLAHLLSCTSPRIVHLSLFMDYAAMCVFGVGAGACTTFWYERPMEGSILFQFLSSPEVFMFLSSATSMLACYMMCLTCHKWQEYGAIIRSAAIGVVFVFSHVPCEDRMAQCILSNKDCSGGVFYVGLTYLLHFSGMLMYALKVPERWAPGKFDLIGNGHQWMHILVGLGTVTYMWAIQTDLREREHILSLDLLTFSSSLAWVLVTVVGCSVIVFWSWCHLFPLNELK